MKVPDDYVWHLPSFPGKGGEMLQVTEADTQADIAEALAHLNAEAKRVKPSPRLDELHAAIDQLLVKWQALA